MREPPRDVLYVIGSLDSGGTENQLLLLCEGLVRRGFRISVYTLLRGGELAPDMIAAGVEVIRPRFESQGRRGRVRGGLLLALSALQLLCLFIDRRPHIVHFLLPEAYIIGGILAKVAMLPRRVMGRRSLNKYQARHRQIARIELWLHRSMDIIVGNSRRVVKELVESEGVPEAKTRLIYNGLGPASFVRSQTRAAVRRMIGIQPDAFAMAIVANLIPYKGHADLFAALGQINSRLPKNWVLLVIGRDDGIGAVLTKLSCDLGIGGNVRFMGARRDVPDLFCACDLGLLCSHEEGFSNSLLEGMAAGLPMIVTDVGGNSEAAIDGVTSILVPPRDPDALGAAILKLCHDRALARRMGAAGRERAKREFSIDQSVEQYELLYRSLGQAT